MAANIQPLKSICLLILLVAMKLLRGPVGLSIVSVSLVNEKHDKTNSCLVSSYTGKLSWGLRRAKDEGQSEKVETEEGDDKKWNQGL